MTRISGLSLSPRWCHTLSSINLPQTHKLFLVINEIYFPRLFLVIHEIASITLLRRGLYMHISWAAITNSP
jgi:hypothetical protein